MKDIAQIAGILLLVAGLPILVWMGVSYMEARAFNNITGREVSTWDAMWVELRVTP